MTQRSYWSRRSINLGLRASAHSRVLKVDDTIADPAAAENIEVSQIAHAIQSSTDCMDSLRRYFLVINKRTPVDAGEKPLQKGRGGYASPSADNIVLPNAQFAIRQPTKRQFRRNCF
jgi:hypothetical protein